MPPGRDVGDVLNVVPFPVRVGGGAFRRALTQYWGVTSCEEVGTVECVTHPKEKCDP